MLFRDRPLAATGRDHDIYLARPRLEEEILRPLRGGRNVLLLGAAGSGKTTLMRQIEMRLSQEGRRSVWVNGGLAESAIGLLQMVCDAFEAQGGLARESDRTQPVDLLALADRLAGFRPGAVLLDGLVDPAVAFDVFGRLRDELWAANHAWLVSARPQDSAPLRTPPADAFWTTVTEIEPLEEAEVARLLELGLDAPERERLAEGPVPLAGFHYRALIREVEDILGGQADERKGRVRSLLEAAGQLGRAEEMAMTELLALGRPASVQEPDLLERLGWSRPYAQRIFSHLEEVGLLRSITESGPRSGRPRKLYEPNPGSR